MSDGAHGKDGYFKFPNTAGVATNYSAQITKVDWDASRKTTDRTAMGSSAKKRRKGQKDGSITIEGWWDKGATSIMLTLYKNRGKSAAFVIGPEGSGTGNERISGNALVENITIKPSIEGTVPFTATLKTTGTFTRDTF